MRSKYMQRSDVILSGRGRIADANGQGTYTILQRRRRSAVSDIAA